jgi:hypothetical protein
LKLRDVARNFIQFQVGDGTNIHLWLDKWHPEGILYLRYGHRLDMIQEGGGKISKCFEK